MALCSDEAFLFGDFYFMIVKTKTKVTLPAQMVDDLEKIPFSKVDKNHAIKFLDNLIRRSYRETGMMDNFVETPSKYLRKAFNKRYFSWLEQLISENIIEVDNSYSTYSTHTYSKSYSIHSKYTLSTIMWPGFEKPALKSISYVSKTEEKMDDEKGSCTSYTVNNNKVSSQVSLFMLINVNYIIFLQIYLEY